MQIEEDMSRYYLETSNFFELDRTYNRDDTHFLNVNMKKQDIFATCKKLFVKVIINKGADEINLYLNQVSTNSLQFWYNNNNLTCMINMEIMKDLISYINELSIIHDSRKSRRESCINNEFWDKCEKDKFDLSINSETIAHKNEMVYVNFLNKL